MSKMENAVSKLLNYGTRIVSFDYDGKRRNVLIGSSASMKPPVWGHVENPAIRSHSGRKYLVGLVNNEGSRKFKTFNLSKIRNPSFA